MSFINDEIIHNWKKNLKATLIIFVISLIGIMSMGLVLLMNFEADEQVEKFKEVYEDVQYYNISDNFVGENEAEMNDEAGLVRLQKFLDLLQNSEHFDYYMMYRHPVYIEDYKGAKENVDNYERLPDATERAEIELEGEDGKVHNLTNVKGFWISDNVMSQFKLNVQSGRTFTSDDFILTDDKASVILGSNYADDYEVGDIIYVDFVMGSSEAEVVGFLEEGTNIYYGGEFINLDRYVIMPIFGNDRYNGKSLYKITNHYYTFRNNGVLATKLSVEDAHNIIAGYSEEAGFDTGYYVKEYYEEMADSGNKETFSLGIESIMFLLEVIVILVVVSTIVILAVCYYGEIGKRRSYYGILVINGCSRRQIFGMIFREICVMLASAYIVGGALLLTITMPPFEYVIKLMVLLFAGAVAFGTIPVLSSVVAFFRVDLINHIKEEI